MQVTNQVNQAQVKPQSTNFGALKVNLNKGRGELDAVNKFIKSININADNVAAGDTFARSQRVADKALITPDVKRTNVDEAFFKINTKPGFVKATEQKIALMLQGNRFEADSTLHSTKGMTNAMKKAVMGNENLPI